MTVSLTVRPVSSVQRAAARLRCCVSFYRMCGHALVCAYLLLSYSTLVNGEPPVVVLNVPNQKTKLEFMGGEVVCSLRALQRRLFLPAFAAPCPTARLYPLRRAGPPSLLLAYAHVVRLAARSGRTREGDKRRRRS